MRQGESYRPVTEDIGLETGVPSPPAHPPAIGGGTFSVVQRLGWISIALLALFIPVLITYGVTGDILLGFAVGITTDILFFGLTVFGYGVYHEYHHVPGANCSSALSNNLFRILLPLASVMEAGTATMVVWFSLPPGFSWPLSATALISYGAQLVPILSYCICKATRQGL
jgi:hypothetical protein